MRKQWLVLLVGLILILGACTGEGQTTATQSPEPETDVQATEVEDTDLPPDVATATPETGEITTGTSTTIECTVTGLLPEIDPTTQALFPAVSGEEWAKGPEDATLTIVEYSDFQ